MKLLEIYYTIYRISFIERIIPVFIYVYMIYLTTHIVPQFDSRRYQIF
jgi:hypothetical protein